MSEEICSLEHMGRDAQHLTIRRVVIEYGSIPTASWLHHIDSTTAITHALAKMREAGVHEGGRCEPRQQLPLATDEFVLKRIMLLLQ